MTEPTDDQRFEMTVDMSVLEALGINLYSNAAAVLSELVANAWDADATSISIDWKSKGEQVIITDNGCGMTAKELNERFLKAGYKKRPNEGMVSPIWKRKFMGRKGIGKLSVFSIADDAQVFSTKDGVSEGFRIDVEELKERISEGNRYYPKPIAVPQEYADQGTTLVLSQLKKRRADVTSAALRKRLARRFDVMDQTPAAAGGFTITINDTAVTWDDRQELKNLEFIWEFGAQKLDSKALPPDIGRFVFSTDVVDADNDWRISGWIGTAKRPDQLTEDDEAGSLKNIIVLARKRPIQEGIIEKLDFSRIFGNYVTGQIEADFLDLDGDDFDDIATSDRQRLIEDDPRVQKLQMFLRERFLEASETWAKVRPKKQSKEALKRYPKIKAWVDGLPQWQRETANDMIGKIASLELERKNERQDRTALFRSGILAFERIALRQSSDDLKDLTTMKAVDLLPVLAAQDAYETALYADILRTRLSAIAAFKELTSADEKEVVLQKHLFDNLWLLDASWERAVFDKTMEEDLRSIAPGEFALDDEGKKITGRIDIRYASQSGRHVIVELKRYKRSVEIGELVDQGTKYAVALRQLLENKGIPAISIEVMFVLGQKPKTKSKGLMAEEEYILNQFRPINGECFLYDELIEGARNQYKEYLDASDKAKELESLLDALDEEGDEGNE